MGWGCRVGFFQNLIFSTQHSQHWNTQQKIAESKLETKTTGGTRLHNGGKHHAPQNIAVVENIDIFIRVQSTIGNVVKKLKVLKE